MRESSARFARAMSYGIILRDDSAGSYYRLMLRTTCLDYWIMLGDDITGLYCATTLQDYITGLYYIIILWDYFTQLY